MMASQMQGIPDAGDGKVGTTQSLPSISDPSDTLLNIRNRLTISIQSDYRICNRKEHCETGMRAFQEESYHPAALSGGEKIQ
jgi:hypothetical protein